MKSNGPVRTRTHPCRHKHREIGGRGRGENGHAHLVLGKLQPHTVSPIMYTVSEHDLEMHGLEIAGMYSDVTSKPTQIKMDNITSWLG